MAEWIDVGEDGIVEEGEVIAVSAAGKPLALFLIEGMHHALYDLCTHGQARLSDGFVENGCIECPLHQGMFEICSGKPAKAPVTEAVPHFQVRVVDGRIEVEI